MAHSTYLWRMAYFLSENILNMKKLILPAVGIILLTGLLSCNDEPTSSNTVTSNGRTIDTSIKMPEPVAPQNTTSQISTTPQSGEAKSMAKLNPPHGEPGHDCAIPVGAPLNSKPSAAATAPAANPAAVPANAKLNPPHGQPGHDCAVPVGAPLKS